MISLKSRFIKGEPPTSGRAQPRGERVDWKRIVTKARTKPGTWLKVNAEGVTVGTSVFRHYDEIEIVQRGDDLYVRSNQSRN